MTENQKLREVATELDRLMLVIESAVRNADPRNHASVMALIRANKEALALPTADHLPDAGEMIETAAPGGGYVRPVVLDARQALPTAAQVDDINVAESFTSAAPVGERELFERWAKDNAIRTDLGAWDAWQARAALSAGDAADGQRTPLTDEQIVEAIKDCGKEDHTKEGWIWRTRIKWARAIEQAHGIDTAMRKGQL